MADGAESLAQVAAEALETAASESERAERAEAVTANVIQSAVEEINAAHEMAEKIAEAAAATELGRQIVALTQEVLTWHDRASNLQTEVNSLSSRLREVEEKANSAATLSAASLMQETAETSSILQPPSQEAQTEALQTAVQTVDSLQSVAVESPAPEQAPASRAKRRWL